MSLNRLSALALLAFAALMALVIIPNNTETVDYGLAPAFLPTVCVIALGAVAVVHLIAPSGAVDLDWGDAGRAAAFLALAAGGVALIHWFGFLGGSIPMALAVMLVAGERRPVWLAAGGVAAPVILWALVEIVLGRPLS